MGKNDTMLVGEYLKDLIKQARTTQKEIAKMLGVHENTVCNWCKGKYKIKSKYVGKLIDYFNKNKYVTNFNPAVLMGVDIPTAFVDNETLNNLKQENQALKEKIEQLKSEKFGLRKEIDKLYKLKLSKKDLDEKKKDLESREKDLADARENYRKEENKKLLTSTKFWNGKHVIKELLEFGEISNIIDELLIKSEKYDVVSYEYKKEIAEIAAKKLAKLIREEYVRIYELRDSE